MPESQDTIENARVGYQVAVNMINSQGEIFWSQFNTLLLANSIVFSAIVFVMEKVMEKEKILLIVLSFFGIILNGLGFSIMKRSYGYFTNWVYSAREIEKQYLKDTFNIFRRGAELSDGKTVYFKLDDENGKETPHQMSCWGRMKAGQSSNIIIFFFLLIYLILLFLTIPSPPLNQ